MRLDTHSKRTMPIAASLIAAGPAVEIGEDYKLLDLNELITKGREGFLAFEVTGNSMVDHIHPGNLVFVDTWVDPKNGDVVASSVNGLTCIKILKVSGANLFLVSANKSYQPRQITANDNFHVLGVVKGHLSVY